MDREIHDYLEFLRYDRDRAPNTLHRYRELLRRFAVFIRVSLGLAVIAPTDIDRRLVEMFVRHGGQPEDRVASPSTRNVRLAALRGFFGYLVAQGSLGTDPTAGLRSAKVKSHSPGYLTEAEFCHLLAAITKATTEHYAIRDAAILTVMFHCGLRVSEALSLTLAQVDLEVRRFHTVTRKGRIVEDVVMNETAAGAVRRWLMYRKVYRRAEASATLFLSDQSRPLSVRALERNFARYVVVAGFAHRHLTPHSLRHSCATALVAHGVALTTVSAVLAHQRVETTKIYVRLAGREKEEALSRLDAHPPSEPKIQEGNASHTFGLTRISGGPQSEAHRSGNRASSNNTERLLA